MHQHYEGYWEYALLCRVCCPEQQRKSPSQHELGFYALLTSLQDRVPQWVAEAHVVGAPWGAADVFFPSIQAVIMVDGEHHFPQGSGHSMRGESGAVQLRHDLLFNVVAVGAEYSVLRLHHLHKHSWQSAVLKFIQYCANGGAPLHFWEPPWMYIKDAQQVWAHG